MAICVKCRKELPDGALYCLYCGESQQPQKRGRRSRGNGEGSVYRRKNGSYIAVKILGYETDDTTGKVKPVKITKGGFKTKKEALAYLPKLTIQPLGINPDETLRGIFELWLPTHIDSGVSRSTIDCYKSAFKYYEKLWYVPFSKLTIESLQECLDTCPRGKRTRQNMKAIGTLLYQYAIPREYVNKNLAHYLRIKGEDGTPRDYFTEAEIERVRQSIGAVPYADYIYCNIYLGFRLNEFLALDVARYNRQERALQGGGKTKAGTNRIVTISPKIQPIIDRLTGDRKEGLIFADSTGKAFTEKRYREKCFYPALELMGLPFPAPDGTERKLTPYSCRHTFATLMKNVSAPDKDKLELMGHTSIEMLQHYQHTAYDDLRAITDHL